MTQPPPPPGYPPQQPGGQAPNNYLVWSILTTLFCCLPFGVVSIVKSSQVNGLWAQGQYGEAQASAEAAKKWAMWAAIAGVVVYIVVIIVNVLGVMAASHQSAAVLGTLF